MILTFINRNTQRFTDLFSLKTMYYSFVRSLLEFDSLVCSKHLFSYNNDLEVIQDILSGIFN